MRKMEFHVMVINKKSWIAGLLLVMVVHGLGFADDWPMWRYDVQRSAASPQPLPERLDLQWVRDYPQLEPTWDDPLIRDLMQNDKIYEPIVLGKTMFVGSNVFDCITALDTETGEEKWTFYAVGPVRFAPVAYWAKSTSFATTAISIASTPSGERRSGNTAAFPWTGSCWATNGLSRRGPRGALRS